MSSWIGFRTEKFRRYQQKGYKDRILALRHKVYGVNSTEINKTEWTNQKTEKLSQIWFTRRSLEDIKFIWFQFVEKLQFVRISTKINRALYPRRDTGIKYLGVSSWDKRDKVIILGWITILSRDKVSGIRLILNILAG